VLKELIEVKLMTGVHILFWCGVLWRAISRRYTHRRWATRPSPPLPLWS